MSYALSAPLQVAVYTALQADPALEVLVGDAIYDALPSGTVPQLYVALGPEKVFDAGDRSGAGARHEFVVSVITSDMGFHAAKQAAGAVSDLLHEGDLTLSRGRLVGMWFHRAKAGRESRGARRIDLTFRARVEDTEVA